MKTRTEYTYIVLGLGGIGSAALYWLARQHGSDVLGVEQFALGHSNGGSQDHSRIIRLSYHTPGYVKMAQAAYAAWGELEEDAAESLIIKTGGLDLSPANAVIPLADYTNSLRQCHVPYELLDAGEVMRRWPQFTLADDVTGLFQAESGIAPAARCNAAHIRMARRHGAAILEQTPISAIRSVGNEIEVTAGGNTLRCHKLIVAAGAWTNQHLAHFGRRLPLTITQEQVVYFDSPHQEQFARNRFPVWIWMDEPCYYGFPVYGEAAVKAAQDVGGKPVTPETRTFEPDPAAIQRLEAFLGSTLPNALGPHFYTKTCLYTMPPDRDFIVDALPEAPQIFVAVGAGHAFKFASILGKTLAQLATDQPPAIDLTPFAIERPILLQQNPPVNFMV